eukprot:s580_g38.t1
MSPNATLPHKTKADVTKCHACYAKEARRYRAPAATKAATRASSVPCHVCHMKRRQMSPSATLPHKTKADVTKCHASAEEARRYRTPAATKAAPEPAHAVSVTLPHKTNAELDLELEPTL